MSRDADIQFRAEFTLDDVFRDLDRIDARVEESRRKASGAFEADPKKASGGVNQAELNVQRAALAQQTAAERAQLQQRVINARAAAAQRIAAERAGYQQETAVQKSALQQKAANDRAANQRELVDARAAASQRVATTRAGLQQTTAAQRAGYARELADQRSANQRKLADQRAQHTRELTAQRTSAQQQTAAYRTGLQQQTVVLRQEGSQRLAVLRSMLRRQEIELKASVGGYKSTASSIAQYFTGGFAQAIRMIAGGNIVASAAIAAFHLLTGAIAATGRALETFITTGLSFAQTLETAERAITALIAANYDFRSSTGGVATGLEAFNLSAEQAKGVLEQLRIAALKSPLTFEELALGLQQTAAVAREAGISIDQLVPITVGISSAVKTLGLDARQVQQEIRGLLSGKIGPSEQLGRALGITGEMVKNWERQGILAQELTKKLEPFNIALQQSQNHADVLASTLQDIGLNFSRLSVESLFEGLKRAGMVLRDGLIDPVSGEFRGSLKAAADVIDQILNRFGKMAEVIAVHIVRGIETVSGWLVQNRQDLGEIADMAVSLVYTIGRTLAEIFQTVGSIFGVSTQTSEEYGNQNRFLQQVKMLLFAVETVAKIIEGVFHGINVVTNSWVGSILSALNPLWQVGNLIARANALMGGGSPSAPTSGSRMETASAGLGDKRGMVTGRRPGEIDLPPGPGGRGGGGSRPENQGPQVISQLREQNALLAAGEGYDRSTLRLQQEQSKELARIVGLQKEHKISAADAATANRLIAEQMALQTAELDEQRNNSYAAVQQDLIMRRLELGQDEIGLIRFKDRIENEALRKRLEKELGIGQQQRINSLVWRDAKIREEVLQKRLDDTRLAAQKEMLELLDREREARLQMFAEWQEQQQQQIEAFSQGDFGNRGAILEQLKQIRGLDDFDIPGFAEELAGLGLTVQTLGDHFGYVAKNVREMKQQLEAVTRFGPLVQEFIGSLQESTDQALETAKQLTFNLIPNVFGALGEALGGALAGVEDFGSAFKKSMFKLLGELASAWGRYFILLGVGNLLFNPALGAAQIAAGVALTALGSFLSAQGQSTPASSSAPADSSSNVADIGEAREKRKIRRQEFNTSGESEERRPLGLFGGAGAGANKLEVDVTFSSTGNAVMDRMIVDHGIVTVKGLGRGSVRKSVRKRIA